MDTSDATTHAQSPSGLPSTSGICSIPAGRKNRGKSLKCYSRSCDGGVQVPFRSLSGDFVLVVASWGRSAYPPGTCLVALERPGLAEAFFSGSLSLSLTLTHSTAHFDSIWLTSQCSPGERKLEKEQGLQYGPAWRFWLSPRWRGANATGHEYIPAPLFPGQFIYMIKCSNGREEDCCVCHACSSCLFGTFCALCSDLNRVMMDLLLSDVAHYWRKYSWKCIQLWSR